MLQVFTQVMLIALLWGPNSGGLMMIGDVAQVMCDKLLGDASGEGCDCCNCCCRLPGVIMKLRDVL